MEVTRALVDRATPAARARARRLDHRRRPRQDPRGVSAASPSARSGSARRSPTLHSDDEVLDTILHEIAHALVGPQHGHDAVWRAKAREIGCTGERCVSSDSPRVPGDWVGRCSAGHEKTPAPRARTADVVRRVLPALRPASPVHAGPTAVVRPPCPARMPRSSPRWPRPSARWSSSRRLPSSVTSSRCRPVRGRGWRARSSWSGAVRCQVRVEDDELVSVPLEAVRVLPASAARRTTQQRPLIGGPAPPWIDAPLGGRSLIVTAAPAGGAARRAAADWPPSGSGVTREASTARRGGRGGADDSWSRGQWQW